MRVRAGFTLIELAVAVAILAIGTMAAYRSFDAAQRGIGGQLDRALATEVALNRAAELRLQGMQAGRGLPPVVSQGGRDWAVSVTESAMAGGLIEATIAVTAPERPGARLVAAVPARGS
ncbi:MAG: prepilin-type N-terminal cleavage/methylation domain-containing protein [Rhodobacter sp.]|uniref:prepilin-type N-terminal cleavage/methylation domain-containing protein n=1 Tax=Pararhodobacter sp. TaxID=2127056 RepID=UPI001DC38916|nr:prepilin-type N-terminal cleavage/methylation domain-containing protein [Pararhodobacter sp.]MCB1345634.1 prepilin-type N-terminal cleavage/methylation domain-containing protein [Paracoccaceae bacterium]MCC0072849.1 prepilin-type N-terminal cleavage/methylation domain-containing protein [Rhodobacter sp.]HPD92503.1 prepilin-type N-terminal cleavage/methylation domain-containing protein [Pararhodobacter sp.]